MLTPPPTGLAHHASFCINQTTGTMMWSYKTTPKGPLGIRSTAAVHADLSVTFGSYNGNVYHLSESGELVWKYDTGSKIYSSISVDTDGTVFAGNYGPPGNCE
jgi:outer membrane protein assembly factor BamB